MWEAQSCDVSDGFSAVAFVGVLGGFERVVFGVDWSNGVPGLAIVSDWMIESLVDHHQNCHLMFRLQKMTNLLKDCHSPF